MVYARRQTRPKPMVSKPKKFDAPTAGWVSNRALSDPRSIDGTGAAILDNFFPMSSKIVLRRGIAEHVTVGEGIETVGAMFSYRNGPIRKLFAATVSNVYDVTTENAPTVVIDEMTSSTWATAQHATTGGVFLIGVNGVNDGFIFDGETFAIPSITFPDGLTTADMSYVWVYKNRLWFAQRGSMNAWYLPVDAIAGTAEVFPFGGIFGLGGSLLFGEAWSTQGALQGGLSEQCIFVSSEGEVAVYAGDDPSEAANWSKIGLYRIGAPLGNNAHFRGGGDIAVATSVGLVPLSKAIELDVTSLNVATISYKIADAWSDAVAQRGIMDWHCKVWPEQKMALIAPPDLPGASAPVVFVSNTETGAWARFTGWNVRSMEVFEGNLYFGATNGKVYLANTSGLDDGAAYAGIVAPLFDDLGSPMSLKVGQTGRAVVRATTVLNVGVAMIADFDSSVPSAPDPSTPQQGSVWGSAIWGSDTWGQGGTLFMNQDWQSIGGTGYACSVVAQVTSGFSVPLDAELIRLEMTYTESAIVS